MRMLTLLARRFVAGDTAKEAAGAVRRLNERGIKATLDFLGEECRAQDQAQEAADEIVGLLRLIKEEGLDANVSLKLTQLGLHLDPKKAKERLLRIVGEAGNLQNFVRVDMEGSGYTQRTLDLFFDVFQSHRNTGIVIQAYLKRSRADIAALCRAGARVRLCKGAYAEPPSVAFETREEVHRSFDQLARDLLDSGGLHALATHDEDRIQEALRYAQSKGIGRDRFEFQMLYGLRPGRWATLREQGCSVRVYVPYGTHWFPYFSRRLRERKENWMFLLRNLLGG